MDTLSSGLFPSLTCQTGPAMAMSPHLELVRQIVSPQSRAALRSVWLDATADDDNNAPKSRSIFTDARDVQTVSIRNAVRAAESDYR